MCSHMAETLDIYPTNHRQQPPRRSEKFTTKASTKKLDELQNNQKQHSKRTTQGHRQEFYPRTVNLTNIKFTKEEQELLDKGM